MTLLQLNRMARRVGVTQKWLRTEAEAGLVPVLQADNRLVFCAEAVEKSLAERASGGLLDSSEPEEIA